MAEQMPTAEIQARLSEMYDRVHPPDPMIEHVVDAPVAAGWTVYRVDGVHTLLPELVPGAPWPVHQRYRQRILANTLGRCPACGEALGLVPDRAMTAVPVTARVVHAPDCPATFTDTDRQWFVPYQRSTP